MVKTKTKTSTETAGLVATDERVKELSRATARTLSLQDLWLQERAGLKRDNLRLLIRDLASAYHSDAINEQEFEDLMMRVCSMFIENEIEERFRKTLTLRLPSLFLAMR